MARPDRFNTRSAWAALALAFGLANVHAIANVHPAWQDKPRHAPALAAQSAGVTYRTVALSGDPAPGTEPGVVFGDLTAGNGYLCINNAGQAAFYAELTGPGVDAQSDSGDWSEGSGALALVSQAPDPVGQRPILNDTGHVGFGNSQGVFSDQSGALVAIVNTGDPLPGTNDTIPGANHIRFNAAGEIGLDVGSFNVGFWSTTSGELQLVALLVGESVGGLSRHFYSLGVNNFYMNDAGQTAFSGLHVNGQNGLWMDDAGTLVLVAESGDPVAGLPGGTTVTGFGNPALNNAGQMAARVGLSGPGINEDNNQCVCRVDAGSIESIAQAGDPAPGTTAGTAFDYFFPILRINSAGSTAFTAYLAGPEVDLSNDDSLLIDRQGQLAMIAREGDQAPGTSPGVVFTSNSPIWAYKFSLNGAGLGAFEARLVGPGVDSTNDHGIWAETAPGELTLVARTGDAFELAPGDTRIVAEFESALGFSYGDDGLARAVNNHGEIAFTLAFTDGTSGHFVAQTQPAPEFAGNAMPAPGIMPSGSSFSTP